MREAGQAREEARRALVQTEREGASSAKRTKLERALQQAEARIAERWPERIEGARRAVRDAQAAIRDYTASNLDELLAGLQAEGEAAADDLNAACQALVEARRRREAIASEMLHLVKGAGVFVEPSDVSHGNADEVARTVGKFLARGGEQAPRLSAAIRERIRATRAQATAA